MKILYALRKLIKRLLCRFILVIEYCDCCGVRQPLIWHVPHSLWMYVTEDENAIYCPKCFDRLAGEKGLLLRWTAQPSCETILKAKMGELNQ